MSFTGLTFGVSCRRAYKASGYIGESFSPPQREREREGGFRTNSDFAMASGKLAIYSNASENFTLPSTIVCASKFNVRLVLPTLTCVYVHSMYIHATGLRREYMRRPARRIIIAAREIREEDQETENKRYKGKKIAKWEEKNRWRHTGWSQDKKKPVSCMWKHLEHNRKSLPKVELYIKNWDLKYIYVKKKQRWYHRGRQTLPIDEKKIWKAPSTSEWKIEIEKL